MENNFRAKRVVFNKLHSKLNFFRVTVWQPQIKKGWQIKKDWAVSQLTKPLTIPLDLRVCSGADMHFWRLYTIKLG